MAHVGMLSSSAQDTGRKLDIRGIGDPSVDPLLEGGVALAALGRAAGGAHPDPVPVRRVAEVLGPDVASDAAAVAANFEIMNRVVDGVGLPFGKGRARQMAAEIEAVGTAGFPHASH
jgi:hypothetical protein